MFAPFRYLLGEDVQMRGRMDTSGLVSVLLLAACWSAGRELSL